MDTADPRETSTPAAAAARGRLQLAPSDLTLSTDVRSAKFPDDDSVLRTYRTIEERFVARQERYQMETQRVLEDLGDLALD